MELPRQYHEAVAPTPLDLAGDAARARWLLRYARAMIVVDTLVLLLASLLGAALRFGPSLQDAEVRGIPYLALSLLIAPLWVGVLGLSRCYETRFVGNGSEEFKRVANASFRVAALLVFIAFMTKTEVARGFLAVLIPVGLCGLVAGRLCGRVLLHRMRRRGRCVHKVVVVGSASSALEMVTTLQRDPLSGLQVVAACVTGEPRMFTKDSLVPVLGSLTDVVEVLNDLGADTVCVAAGPGVTAAALRDLSYQLEGTGVDLLVSPVLTNVTGTRLSSRTIPGLPLLHVDEPELDGSRRLIKGIFDRTLGLLGLLLVSPLLLAIAVAIRLTSSGPALFRQERIGRAGKPFQIWKFRSMYVDAEQQRETLVAENKHGLEGVLFKVEADPRVTPVGRFLRRYSLDELPQLVNVVLGHMSLVGPRPPLQDEVDRYDGHVHRRLLVKPGMTGLWQVSGRADLPWEESVRLDLHYVENWSLGLDVAVLCKTVMAVVRPSGAY
ncbi:MAG TPA: sugar transferase [Mycobacteriales bacterium]|nr:sugar transferase [Mycobacteriales bacterium]